MSLFSPFYQFCIIYVNEITSVLCMKSLSTYGWLMFFHCNNTKKSSQMQLTSKYSICQDAHTVFAHIITQTKLGVKSPLPPIVYICLNMRDTLALWSAEPFCVQFECCPCVPGCSSSAPVSSIKIHYLLCLF